MRLWRAAGHVRERERGPACCCSCYCNGLALICLREGTRGSAGDAQHYIILLRMCCAGGNCGHERSVMRANDDIQQQEYRCRQADRQGRQYAPGSSGGRER
jgi:hypothetical protein